MTTPSGNRFGAGSLFLWLIQIVVPAAGGGGTSTSSSTGGGLGGLGSAEHEGQQSDLPVELEPRDCVLQEAGAFKEDVLQATGTSERQKDDQASKMSCYPERHCVRLMP